MKQDITANTGPAATAQTQVASVPPANGPSPLPEAAAKPRSDAARTRSRLVVAMMGLVTTAFAAGLYIQFAFPAVTAILAGAALCSLLVALHTLTAKGDQVDKLKTEVQRLEGEINQLKGALLPARGMPSAHLAALAPAPAQRPYVPEKTAGVVPPPTAHIAVPSADAVTFNALLADRAPVLPHKLEPEARWEQPKPAPKSRLVRPESDVANPAQVLAAPAPGAPPAPADPLRDAWSFRPKDAEVNLTGRAVGPGLPAPDVPVLKPVPTIDRELEMVQRKIKALADEVNAAETSRAPVFGEPAVLLPAALDQSIGALKAVSQSMRERTVAPPPAPRMPEIVATNRPFPSAEFIIPATAERIAISSPEPESNDRERDRDAVELPRQIMDRVLEVHHASAAAHPAPAAPLPVAPPGPDARIAAIAHAVHIGDMDVCFSPIVGLQDQAVRHYEVSVRLKTPSGSVIENAEDVIELAGPDLVGLYDSQRLARSAQFAGRLDALRKPGSVLCPVTGGAMTDGRFLETFARLFEERQNIAAQLVLTFSQADIARFSTSAWQALGDMQAFGFRFAAGNIQHLDMDFAALAQRGFAFAKLPALALVDGLPLGNGVVPAGEICRHLAGAGLTLIAGEIDDEAMRARIFGFGVLAGQGQLFGGARPINLDTAARTAAA